MQPARDDERDRERDREADRGELQDATAQPREVDLQPGEEQQEREAERRDHRDRLIDVHPAEHARADDDPGHDLQHDGRQPHAREEAEHERRAERDRGDDQQTGEGRHGRWSFSARGVTRNGPSRRGRRVTHGLAARPPFMATTELRWYRVADLDELPEGRVKTVAAGTRSLALTHVDGEYAALDNHCPHQGGPLGEGSIEGGLLRCPWHGYDYCPLSGDSPGGFGDSVPTHPVDRARTASTSGSPTRRRTCAPCRM